MTQDGDSPSSMPSMSGGNSSATASSPETDYTTAQCHRMDVLRLPLDASSTSTVEYPPRIPVALRHPRLVASVKQYRSEAQQQQLQHYIVSESFIPVEPDNVKPPRRRRRPPFSYSSLIAQAILGSEDERMTLQEIYKWIMDKYPALYDAHDTGWQNTIRHNLSLNSCFKKIPKVQMDGLGPHGKGGYWTVDPSYMAKYKNGSFSQGISSVSRRKQPREIRMKGPEEQHLLPPSSTSTSSSSSTSLPQQQQQQQQQLHHHHHHQPLPLPLPLPQLRPLSIPAPPPLASPQSLLFSPTGNTVPKCIQSSPPPPKRSSPSSSQVMQIQNLLN